MGWAVILLPDEHGDTAARRLWDAVRQTGFHSPLFEGENRPHVSLAVLEGQDGTLGDVAKRFASETGPVTVTFAAMGRFGEDVIWLAPEPAAALHAMNRDLTARLGPLAALADRHYLPGEWQPHMTMVFQVPEGGFTRAWKAVKDRFAPFSTTLGSVAVVKFHPVRIMGVWPLSPRLS